MPIPEKYQTMFEEMKLSFLEQQEQARLEHWEWTINDEIVDILINTSCSWKTRKFVEDNYFKLRDDFVVKIKEKEFKRFIKEKMMASEEKIINATVQEMIARGVTPSIKDIDKIRDNYTKELEALATWGNS